MQQSFSQVVTILYGTDIFDSFAQNQYLGTFFFYNF